MGRRFNPLLFLRDQYRHLPTFSPGSFTNLAGRTVIITGANSGIGLEAARALHALHPAKLILAQRSLEKGQRAVQSIRESGGEGRVEAWELDLSNFESVRTFARRANSELDRLDILIENAGIRTLSWTTTPDGWEESLQANVISTGLLALLLVPLMRRTVELPKLPSSPTFGPHLVIVSSYMHALASFPEHTSPHPVKALNVPASFDRKPSARYAVTKLLALFQARELAILAGPTVRVSAVDPGFTYSNLRRESRGIGMSVFEAALARQPHEGAKNHVWAALEESYPTGSYIANCQVTEASAFSDSEEGRDAQKRVWEELKTLWSEIAPEVKDVL